MSTTSKEEAKELLKCAETICKRCRESEDVIAFAICPECACKFVKEMEGEVK